MTTAGRDDAVLPGRHPDALFKCRDLVGGQNPFAAAAVRSPWDEPAPVDVPGINRGPTDILLRMLDEVRERPQPSRLAVMLADEGMGKTHLLSRIRGRLAPHRILACASPSHDGARAYRDLLAQVIGDLARRPAADSPDQLSILVAHALAIGEASRRWPEAHLDELKADERLLRRQLNARLLAIEERYDDIDLEILDHLLRLPFEPKSRQDLLWWWLSGSPLAEEQLEKLGLDTNVTDENHARQVNTTLAALGASAKTPILLAFDRIETLTLFPEASGPFAHMVATLLNDFPGLVVLIAARPEDWAEHLEPRIGATLPDDVRVIQLGPPSRAQAVALSRARCGVAGLGPVGLEDIEGAWHADPRPRSTLEYLAGVWDSSLPAPRVDSMGPTESTGRAELPEDQWDASEIEKTVVAPLLAALDLNEGRTIPREATMLIRPDDLGPPDVDVFDMLDEVAAAAAERDAESSIDVDDALPAVLHALSRVGHRATSAIEAERLPKNVVALVRYNDSPVLIARGDHGHGGGFAYRVRWMIQQLEAWRTVAPEFRAILMRDEERPIPRTWKKGREYLDDFVGNGGELVSVTGRDRSVLEAARVLLAWELPIRVAPHRLENLLVTWPGFRGLPLIDAILPALKGTE